MKNTITIIAATALACAAFSTPGCKRDQQEETQQPTASEEKQTATLPPGLIVTEAPAGARTVADLKADASATGEVVIQGRIGGRKEPFVAGAAVFLLADTSMKACNELHGDSCRTPWDYCCEPRESLAAKTATIQIVDADGKPLRINIKNEHGLTPLTNLTIAGRLAPRDTTDTLIINAKQIYIQPTGT